MTAPTKSDDHNPDRSPQMQAFEAQLSALRPREDRLDREQLMFLAGQASVGGAQPVQLHEPRRWAWPASLGALAGAAAASVAMLLARPVPTAEIASSSPAEQRQVNAIAAASSGAWSPRMAADFAVLRDLNDERLLTAGMALGPAPRVLIATARQKPAGEMPIEAPAPKPSLTTRSVGELLAPSGAGEFSS